MDSVVRFAPPVGYRPGPSPGTWVLDDRTVEVECDQCRLPRQVPVFGTFVPRCQHCGGFGIYLPQLPLDLDPRRDARERAVTALLAWPPIATLEDWRLRNG